VPAKLTVMFPYPAQQGTSRGGPPDPQRFAPATYRAVLRRADHACCCSARPAVVAVMPPVPGRDHATDLCCVATITGHPGRRSPRQARPSLMRMVSASCRRPRLWHVPAERMLLGSGDTRGPRLSTMAQLFVTIVTARRSTLPRRRARCAECSIRLRPPGRFRLGFLASRGHYGRCVGRCGGGRGPAGCDSASDDLARIPPSSRPIMPLTGLSFTGRGHR
jgi:hypothetical protein